MNLFPLFWNQDGCFICPYTLIRITWIPEVRKLMYEKLYGSGKNDMGVKSVKSRKSLILQDQKLNFWWKINYFEVSLTSSPTSFSCHQQGCSYILWYILWYTLWNSKKFTRRWPIQMYNTVFNSADPNNEYSIIHGRYIPFRFSFSG